MDELLSPMIQYGFAGFAVLQLGVIIWTIKKLVSVLEQNSRVIEANTNAINQVSGKSGVAIRIMEDIRRKLLSRPCIARGEMPLPVPFQANSEKSVEGQG